MMEEISSVYNHSSKKKKSYCGLYLEHVKWEMYSKSSFNYNGFVLSENKHLYRFQISKDV
jgi:hypothetical protein